MPGNNKLSIKVNCYFKLDRRKSTDGMPENLFLVGVSSCPKKIATYIVKSSLLSCLLLPDLLITHLPLWLQVWIHAKHNLCQLFQGPCSSS